MLEYLADVAVEDLEPEEDEDGDEMAGFKLTFTFAPNPYFENEALVRPDGCVWQSFRYSARASPACNWGLVEGADPSPGLLTLVGLSKQDPEGTPNSSLPQTKTYFIYEEDGEPMLSRAEGTDISWKAGKNVTVKVCAQATPTAGAPAGAL